MTHDYHRRLVETTGNRQPTSRGDRDGKSSLPMTQDILENIKQVLRMRGVYVESILSDVPCIAIAVYVTVDLDPPTTLKTGRIIARFKFRISYLRLCCFC